MAVVDIGHIDISARVWDRLALLSELLLMSVLALILRVTASLVQDSLQYGVLALHFV